MKRWEEGIRKVVPYVPGEQPKRADVVKLNTNENPYPPSTKAIEALHNMDTDALRKYPDPEASVLIDAISEVYGVDRKKIFVGVGSDDVLGMSFLTFFNTKRPVIFPDITYSFYDVWADLFKIPYKTIPLNEHMHIDTDDYKIENGGVVIANPNAPTGIAVPKSYIEDIVKANQNSVVIVDEAYVDFGAESALSLIDEYENVLVVQTFSKSRSMAGMRIGYAFGSETLIKALNDVKYSYNSYTMDMPTIYMGAAAMRDTEYLHKTTNMIMKTRDKVSRELRNMGFEFDDSSANFIFVTHPKIKMKELFEALKQEGIYVRYFNKPRIDNYLRISIGSDKEMDKLISAIKGYLNK